MNNQLEYKGYRGTVESSLEDHCLFGKLLSTKALISYEGNTLEELEVAFRKAVDDFHDSAPTVS